MVVSYAYEILHLFLYCCVGLRGVHKFALGVSLMHHQWKEGHAVMFFPTVVASVQGLHPRCAGHPHSLDQRAILT